MTVENYGRYWKDVPMAEIRRVLGAEEGAK
jgi:hypothetical protein